MGFNLGVHFPPKFPAPLAAKRYIGSGKVFQMQMIRAFSITVWTIVGLELRTPPEGVKKFDVGPIFCRSRF